MSNGSCLCGSIGWSISGQPTACYHCHCMMCRKVHGAAFATYLFVKADDFEWQSDLQTLQKFKPAPEAQRTFCSQCGSVVPHSSHDGEVFYVPAGSHDQGPKIDAHVFVASKAPWFNITDELPQYDEYTPEEDLKVYPDKPLADKPEGVVRGSCLCNAVKFEVTEPFKFIHNCHCSRCRRARSAAFTTNGFTCIDGVRFSSGELNIKLHKVPGAKFFTHAFCATCGSGMPRKDPDRGIAVIPLGALDDDPKQQADDHIFTDSKAGWYEITDDLPQFKQMPE